MNCLISNIVKIILFDFISVKPWRKIYSITLLYAHIDSQKNYLTEYQYFKKLLEMRVVLVARNLWLNLKVLGPQWSAGANVWITWRSGHITAFWVHRGLDMFSVSCGKNIYRSHAHRATLGILCPKWALGATAWPTCKSSYFREFCVPLGPGIQYIFRSCMFRHFKHPGPQLRRRKQCMNDM